VWERVLLMTVKTEGVTALQLIRWMKRRKRWAR
jgi:hypothetical protein